MPEKQDKPRWQFRYDNFQRAVVLLREALEMLETGKMSQLEREGMIQRFEFCWELIQNDLVKHISLS